jgi:hypothetical protein
MIIGLFELIETTSQTLPNNLTNLFYQYGLKKTYCICEKWKVKFNYNDNCFEINC